MTLEHEYDVFVRAANSFTGLVGRIDSSAWDSPGLGDWDLRALVGHASRSLITVTQYVDRPVDRQELASPQEYYLAASAFAGADHAGVVERGRQAGAALGPDPATAVAGLAAAAVDRLRDQPDMLLYTIVGGMWLSDYLPTRTFELVVHNIDIARAINVAHPEDAAALTSAVELAAQVAVHSGRGAEVLLALTGRDRLSDGFSVV